ncbi:ShlB/FhaC/HecB family hemolysin secretion/activation protein [Saccharospirillum sp. HFRX-1]|uniref:ShlB/FhaC/HecB family hemolysin secretion/activation protein n=1 Tax=unclassified Saccharospirillum TaxID=2633430 RepID=UPI003720B3A3
MFVLFIAPVCAWSAQAPSQETLDRSEQESLEQFRRFEGWQDELNERFLNEPDIFLDTPQIPLAEEPEEEAGPCFPITEVRLVSDEYDRFQWLEKNLNEGLPPDNCIGAEGINRMMTEAQNAVIGAGFVTSRVVAEAQDMNSGVLSLTLLPGYVEDIRFVEGVPRRATYWNALPMRRGDLLNLRHIEQALENFKRVPSVDVNIDIEPGEEPGYSDLVIQWSQGDPLRVTETLDNSGSESSGIYQAGVTINYDPYWAFNDLFYLSYTQSIVFDVDDHGSQGVNGHYSIPYGYWLLSFNGGISENFQMVEGVIEDYKYGGTNANQSVKVERTLFRNDRNKLSGHLSVQARQSANYINDVEIEVQRRRSSSLEAALNHQLFVGRATLSSGLTYKLGLMAFGAIEDPEVTRGDGVENPQWFMMNTGYRQPFQWLNQNWSIDSQIKAQANITQLIPRDQFSIGSAYSVRGFNGGFSGESGFYWRNDLTWVVPALSYLPGNGHQLTLGLDAGTIFAEDQYLAGSSLGLKGQLWGLSYENSLSFPLVSPESLETEGTIYRFQISKSF